MKSVIPSPAPLFSGISAMFLAPSLLFAQQTPVEFPIRGPIHFYNPWLWASIAIVLIALVILVAWWIRKCRLKAAAPIPETPPDVEALAALARLKNSPWTAESKPFVFAVSEILRRYIERTFKIPALEQTTEEFMQTAVDHPILGTGVSGHLREVIETGDLVKFAGQSLDQSKAQTFLDSAETFVKSTENKLSEERAAANTPPTQAPLPPPKPFSQKLQKNTGDESRYAPPATKQDGGPQS